MESNDSLNNIDTAFNTYKQQLKYSGSILGSDKSASHQKLLSTKQKFLTMNAENSFEILLSDSFTSKKPSGNATTVTTSDIYVDDQKLSPTSSTSSTSSSRINDYSPINENMTISSSIVNHSNQEFTTKPSIVTNNNHNNNIPSQSQKLDLQQRIAQKRHSLSIK